MRSHPQRRCRPTEKRRSEVPSHRSQHSRPQPSLVQYPADKSAQSPPCETPASSSGKYHPIQELGPDGTILHTKKVFTLAYELCRGLGCENERDAILSACIIHDLRKQGLTKTGHTVKNHPDLAVKLVTEVQESTMLLDDEVYKSIKNMVGYHYGLWSSGTWQKSLSDYTPGELCVYISDYVSSKRCVEVDYRR